MLRSQERLPALRSYAPSWLRNWTRSNQNGWRHMVRGSEDSSSKRHLMSFIHHETTAGVTLVLAAILAIVAFNSDTLRPLYENVLSTKLLVSLGSFGISKPLLLWINDGLMAI